MKGIYQSYYGGKGGTGVYQNIINLIPPHALYIEPFVGNGGILRHLRPAQQSVCVDMDSEVIKRWRMHPINAERRVKWINGNGITLLRRLCYEPPEVATVIYLDPPYLAETRRGNDTYKYEITPKQHRQILDYCSELKRLGVFVFLSCYENSIYSSRLADWQRHTFRATTRGQTRTEVVYYSSNEEDLQHDYRYLGADKRARERIRRIVKRNAQKFFKLDKKDQYALFDTLLEKMPAELIIEALVRRLGPLAAAVVQAATCPADLLDQTIYRPDPRRFNQRPDQPAQETLHRGNNPQIPHQ